jgi:ATP-dependent helicase/nuclease subunit B
LLERARVSVRDETGWKLSTTSAAAAVMRWYDLVADDLYWRDLLDWLKSNFTLADHADKPAAVAGLERAIRAGGALQGARSIRRALSRSGTGPAADTDAAHAVLALIEAQAQTMQRAAPTLASHARALRSALDALGMRTALAADAVGAAVLDEIDALEADLAGVTGRATLAEFRALLAERFEEVSFTDRAVDSPVVLVSLAAAALRRFDAALLIGADAQHLPAAPTESLFMSGAVRAELGLASVESALREQACQLAALVASTPRVLATWRTRHGDEPNSLSPLLERLQFVAERALDDDLLRDAERDLHEVRPLVLQRPAPAAAQLLPQRISASAAQSLVNCAYQFYARRLLQLTAPDDVIETPDKRDFGELLHEILRRFHRQWGAVGFHDIDAARLASSLSLHAHAVFDPRIEQAPGLLAFKRRFEGLIAGYVDWLQGHAAEGWRWSAAEESFAATMTLNDGRSIELGGRIDRIDAQADGRMHLLDYKARSVDALAKALQEPGEDIQLPFYGLLLAHRVQSAAYLSFDRAREDAAGVEAVAPKQDFGRLVDAVEQRLRADLQRIADGAALPAIGAPSVCRYCEMRGLCRRDYWDDSAADEMQ